MEKSGFFNSLNVNGEYDRKYNANDYCDNLAVVINNGVLRSILDDLKVTVNGRIVTVGVGRAWINGHYYYNTTPYSFTVPVAPAGGSRYDRVILRLNNNITARRVALDYVQGEAGNVPVKPAPVRNEAIYDLVLADVYLTAGATGAVVTDTRADKNICGWVYSVAGDNSFFTTLDNNFNEWFQGAKDTLASVTLFKRYTWQTTIQTTGTSQISFNIPQYDAETCFVEVYVNGILYTRYILNNNIITFEGTLTAGTVVTVNCYKSIDGTGIMTVADEITELQQQFASVDGIARYTYTCTGVNDNITITQIVAAIFYKSYVREEVTPAAAAFLEGLGGNAYLATLDDQQQFNFDIVGEFIATTPYSGEGTDENPYKWICIGANAPKNTRIIFNFAKCSKININCAANTSNIIFYGNNQDVQNVNIKAYSTQSGCKITMIKAKAFTGRINYTDCRFEIDASGAAMIAEHGTFTNCYGYVVSDNSTAYCFKPRSTGLIKLNSGEYYAYGLASSGIVSAIIHTSAGDVDAVVIAYNLHCPVVTRTNYAQGFLSVANAGNTIINNVVTRLTSSGTYNTINGLVNKNKA